MAADSITLTVPTRDGTTSRRRCDIGRDALARMVPLIQRNGVRSDIYVAHHVPAGADGRDFYARMRAANPGHFWHIGSTMFETDRIPATWVPACNGMDEIWVPTEFNRGTFAHSGVDRDRIRVMPFGVADLRRPAVPGALYPLATEKSFRFLSVFEMTPRKGWDVLVRAWLEAFRASDDVALVLRTYGRDGAKPLEALFNLITSLGRDPEDIPEIVLVEEHLTDAQMLDLYAQCHAFVLPTRGEGWGMPYLESLSIGLPVIATRWSAHLDFLHDDNSFLVDIEGLRTLTAAQAAEVPLYAGHQWAEPSVASLIQQMQRMHGDAALRTRRAARGHADARQLWNTQAMAARMRTRLDEVEGARRAASARSVPAGASADPLAPATVVWRAPIFDPSGYASEARTFIKDLVAAGDVGVRVEPEVWSAQLAEVSRDDRALFNRLCNTRAAAGAISIQHVFAPMFRAEPDARRRIGRTMFESDRIPESWVGPCNALDEVWVPCTHNMETFARAGVAREKLVLVPGVIDFTRWTVDGPKLAVVADAPFTFLSVFDWSSRKGWDVLLRAYADAFSGRRDVQLVIKLTISSGLPPDAIEAYIHKFARAATPRGRSTPAIRVLGPLADADMPALYRAADCFVLPTRGEGFGRPFMEAMAVGTPAIGTGWGGQLDFMTPSNAWLIKHALVPVPETVRAELPTFMGHRWAEPDVADLRRIMRAVAADKPEARARGLRAAADVRRTHDPAAVARLIRQRLGW